MATRILIVFYNPMWSGRLDIPPGIPLDCELSAERRRFLEATAVVFHIPSLDPRGLPPKRPGQLWVAWSIECEVHYPQLRDPDFMRRFDITMTYRRDADVQAGYVGTFGSAEQMERALRRPARPKDADRPATMWISSATDRSGRQGYARELARHVPIDSYGRFMRNRTLPRDDGRPTKLETIAHYRFTLAFENAIGEDYVTEKFFDPLVAGSVPVYLGAPNVETFAPGEHCYVNVNDFASPRALGEYLCALSRDDAAYGEYLAWRSRPFRPAFVDFLESQRTHAFIRLCRRVQAATAVTRSRGA